MPSPRPTRTPNRETIVKARDSVCAVKAHLEVRLVMTAQVHQCEQGVPIGRDHAEFANERRNCVINYHPITLHKLHGINHSNDRPNRMIAKQEQLLALQMPSDTMGSRSIKAFVTKYTHCRLSVESGSTGAELTIIKEQTDSYGSATIYPLKKWDYENVERT